MNKFVDKAVTLFIAGEGKDGVTIGQPSFFLWGGDHVDLFEEPTWFLYKKYVMCGSTPSVHTWSAAAHDIKTWFQYLQAKGLDWHNASETERAKARGATLFVENGVAKCRINEYCAHGENFMEALMRAVILEFVNRTDNKAE